MSGQIHILGPQRPTPNIANVLNAHCRRGPIAVISAGWRYDESEIQALTRDIQREVYHLPLYEWFDELGDKETELSNEHSERQKKIKAYKKAYRMRLQLDMEYLAFIHQLHKSSPVYYEKDLIEARKAIAKTDHDAITRLNEIRLEFPNLQEPWLHASAASYHQEIKDILEKCDVLIITGGHVAILRNRMFFFGLHALLKDFLEQGKSIICWSAGAMSLTDEIVLYYDDPPDGKGTAEVLDTGLNLIPNTLFFPHGRQRLKVDEQLRISSLVHRFTPKRCFILEEGSHMIYQDQRLTQSTSTIELFPDGTLAEVQL